MYMTNDNGIYVYIRTCDKFTLQGVVAQSHAEHKFKLHGTCVQFALNGNV